MLTPELKQKEDIESQTSSTRGTSPQEPLVRPANVPWKPLGTHQYGASTTSTKAINFRIQNIHDSESQ